MARAIWPGDDGIFRCDQHLTIWTSEQGAERLVAVLARLLGQRDSGREMLEIQIGHVSTIWRSHIYQRLLLPDVSPNPGLGEPMTCG